jgi:heptosyltransferase-2
MKKDIKKILVVGPSWVGDMVMAQSLFIAFKVQNPDVVIDVLAPSWSAPLLARMPEVNKAIEMPLGHGRLGLSDRWKMGRALVGLYDQAILLPNSLKSAIVPWAAKIPVRTGWKGEMRYGLLNDLRSLDKAIYTKTVQRFVALAYEKDASFDIENPRLSVERKSVEAALTKFSLVDAEKNKVLGLCPGAEFGPSKQWPAEHYANLAKEYIQRGWSIWLFGSAKDQAITQKINQDLNGEAVDLAGHTSLAEAIDLLSTTDAVVSNDSGLMHVAAALERPLVAVYGSTDPNFTPPLGALSRVVDLGLECSPCFKRECPLVHMNCMNQIEPRMVIDAMDQLIGVRL